MPASDLRHGPISNPFATRYVRPGVIPWVGSGHAQLESIVSRFDALDRCAAIVGPHGSGKTTLLHHLVPMLVDRWEFISPDGKTTTHAAPPPSNLRSGQEEVDFANDRMGVWLQLRRGQSQRLGWLGSRRGSGRVQLWILDGYEQLYWYEKLVVRLERYRSRFGLLVTSHTRPLQIPQLFNTELGSETAMQVIQQIGRDLEPNRLRMALPSESKLKELLERESGSLREVFMSLYDDFEQATQSEAG